MNLDKALPADVQGVLNTAGLLEISEYKVFELAHSAWFGAAVGPLLGRAFRAYMYRDAVPPWVRAFTREVLRRDHDGALDPADYGIVHAPPTPTMIYLGIRYAVLTALTLIVIYIAALHVEDHSGCMFPPCY